MLGERRGALPFPAAPTEAGAGPRKGVKSLNYFVLLTRHRPCPSSAMWSALAPGARAGAARAGDDSGRVPDVWATLAGALQALLFPSEDRSLLSS